MMMYLQRNGSLFMWNWPSQRDLVRISYVKNRIYANANNSVFLKSILGNVELERLFPATKNVCPFYSHLSFFSLRKT